MMNRLSDPCPESFVLTIVSKLNPKSTPTTLSVDTPAGAIDWVYWPGRAWRAASVWEPLFAGASTFWGCSPPTLFVTGEAVPEEASGRNVCTPSSVPLDPVREERTEELTTRTV